MVETPLLDTIKVPSDLRKVPLEDLPEVCRELREYLVEVVSGIGGHLASSLGAVELTVALHYVLDTPEDILVWDVGHQAYIHKILTGRKDALPTIRQYGGISGFLKRNESEYDVYGAGHASTALSAAYGMAVARDLQNEERNVACVVGDGALTGGLCYEAINNIGSSRRPFLIILNDNQMSISPNVGAINRYLMNFAQTQLYQTFRRQVRENIDKIPRIGKPMNRLARRLEEAAKTLLTPGAFFEAMGLNYYGPVDGHNVVELVKTIRNLLTADTPVILHALTVKGKGYKLAEESPEGYHGVKPFHPDEGILPKPAGKPAYLEVFGQSLCKAAEKNPKIVAITAAMPTGTGLVPFSKQFPERFFDVGIAEEHAVVFASGLAAQGMRPVCAIYSTFLQRAFDPIVHDTALQHLPVIFCLDRAGLVGEDGPTHHGAFDLSYLRLIPEMVVSAPRNGGELRDLLTTALEYTDGPFAIRYPKAAADGFNPETEGKTLSIGSWEVLAEGSDAAILAVGSMTDPALAASQMLEQQGIHVEVVNCRFVKPMDESYLASMSERFPLVATVEENALAGGFGAGVIEWLEGAGSHNAVLQLGIPDRFITHGPRGRLLEDIGLSAEGIAGKILAGLRNQGKLPKPRVVVNRS